MGADNVCLDSDPGSNTCPSDFEFFLITLAFGFQGLDGILGMSPPNPDNGPSYVQTLYSQGKIAEEVATFQINLRGTTSSVTFGGIPDGLVNGELTKLDLVKSQDSWWTVELSEAFYGDTSIKVTDVHYAILDTGTSFLTLSHSDYT